MSDLEDIWEATDKGILTSKRLVPYVEYEAGYSHHDLPPLYRVRERFVKHFYGVRSCSDRDVADSNAKELLEEFKKVSIRYNPELEVVRSGWVEGEHYWNNNGGRWGQARSCHGFVSSAFYVDFRRPDNLSDFVVNVQKDSQDDDTGSCR
ncbi:hypothetical protein [Microbulbifer hainanensis]|uniref:hypothetical protein n=1 Tax=Microbulbifer hainanensis TaxID=2735675 RepID=UPI0018695455|nr:hypothetical protein [Microbulbifer hainanensis]